MRRVIFVLSILFTFLFINCASIDHKLGQLSSDEKRDYQILYYGIKAAATNEEFAEFKQINPKDKVALEEWQRVFWKKKDPTPTNDKNEFQAEHNRRAEFVLFHFNTVANSKPWDARGDIYIKYGEPDEREINPIDLTDNNRYLQGKIGSVTLGFNTEVWRYYKDDRFFKFEPDKAGEYILMPYTEKGGLPGTDKKILAEVTQAQTRQQKEIYEHDYGGKALDYAFDVVRFRERDNVYLVDLNLGIPVSKLKFRGEDTTYIDLVKEVALFDKKLKLLKRDSTKFSLQLKKDSVSGSILVDQKTFILPPGQFTLAAEIRDLNSNRVGIYKKELLLPEFVHSEIREISEVIIASNIRPAEGRDERFIKSDLVVQPMPTRTFFPNQDVYFYFEIYDLKKDIENKCRYLVNYDLLNTETKKELSLGSQTVEVDSSQVYQIGEIKSDKVGKGEYILIIKVRDLNGQKEKKTLASFKIM
jgi:GWxTD domain-containing protein